jgi:hypothetical protein
MISNTNILTGTKTKASRNPESLICACGCPKWKHSCEFGCGDCPACKEFKEKKKVSFQKRVLRALGEAPKGSTIYANEGTGEVRIEGNPKR